MSAAFIDPRLRVARPNASASRQTPCHSGAPDTVQANAGSPSGPAGDGLFRNDLRTLAPLLERMAMLAGAPVCLIDRIGRPIPLEATADTPAPDVGLADLARRLESEEDIALTREGGDLTAWATRLMADGVHMANLVVRAKGSGNAMPGGELAELVLPLFRAIAPEIAHRLLAQAQARDARSMATRLLTRGTSDALAAEGRLNRMADQLPGVLYQYRLWPDGRCTFPYATEGLRAIYGLAPADVRDDGLAVAQVIHPDDIDRVVESILHSARTLTPWHERYRVNHPTRGLIHVDGHSQPEQQPDGSVLWHGLVLDVTDRVRSRETLSQAVSDLERAQRIAHVGNWKLDPAVGVPQWSAEVYRIYERDPSRPPPSVAEYDTLYEGADLDRLHAAIDGAVQNGVGYDLTLSLALPDGRRKWIWAVGEPEPEPGPAGHVVHGVIQDVTQACEDRNALIQSQEKLRLVLAVAEDGVWDFNVATRTVEWNSRFFQMLGHQPGDFTETFEAWRDRIHPEDWPRVSEKGEHAIAKGLPFEVEYRIRRADGSWLWIWDQARPVGWTPDGKVARLIGTATDIDARKRKELAEVEARVCAEQANVAKTQFMAAMSHELRTPLNAILGFSEIMKDEMLGPLANPVYRQYAADIHASGSHLVDLISGLMDLAKIEAGRRELNIRSLSVSGVAHAIVPLLEQRAVNAGLTLVDAVPADTPPVRADDLALRQILFNLLSNAIKFTPRGGRVTLSAAPRASGGIAISVADTGIGIAPDDRARLFQPFTRAPEARKRRIEGTGLGLALVKSLMDLHGGTVSVDSSPNRGSTFTVCFPGRSAGPCDNA